MAENLIELIDKEGWKVKKYGKDYKIVAFGEEFPATHPIQIYLKKYREETFPVLKFEYMKKAHDYLWPKDICTWHE